MSDNSGSAFPGIEGADGYGNQSPMLSPDGERCYMIYQPGMSMRDYFAAKALQGEIIAISGISSIECDRMATARWCYLMADAMLKARDEHNAS